MKNGRFSDAQIMGILKQSEGGIQIQYIQPSKPQQNTYIERYNRTVRHKWLNIKLAQSRPFKGESSKR